MRKWKEEEWTYEICERGRGREGRAGRVREGDAQSLRPPAVRDESDGGGPAGAAPHAQEPQRAAQLQQGVAALFSAAAATATTATGGLTTSTTTEGAAATAEATTVGSAVCDGSPVLIFGVGVSLFDGLRGRRRRQRAPKPGDKSRSLIRAESQSLGRSRSIRKWRILSFDFSQIAPSVLPPLTTRPLFIMGFSALLALSFNDRQPQISQKVEG